MKLVEGTLKRLGESTVNMKNQYVKYSLIQIGDQTLTNVMVDTKLNNFLNDGLETTASTKLWFLDGHKVIMGVQVGDSSRYYGKINPFFYFGAVWWVGMSIAALFLHWSIAIFMGVLTWWLFFRKIADYGRVKDVGGVKV